MIPKLFHLTHIDNVLGIAKRGLLCRSRIDAQGLTYIDLSEPTCQARRTHRSIGTDSVDLHCYVPLFINPRNPMLYRLLCSLKEQGHAGELAILEISGAPSEWHASLLADGIASSLDSRLFQVGDPSATQALDWNAVHCEAWGQAPRDVRRKTMAEVLVKGSLAQRHIRKVWLQNNLALEKLAAQLPSAALSCCQVDDRKKLFYHA